MPATLLNQPYALTTIATCLLATFLGAVVLWKNPKDPAARMWALMCFCVGLWAFCFTGRFIVTSETEALWVVRLDNLVAMFIPPLFLHFVMNFLGRPRSIALQLSYAATLLVALTAASPRFIPEATRKFGMWFDVAGPTYVLYTVLFISIPSYGIWLLFQEAQKTEGIKRTRLLCLLFSTLVGFGGGFMWFPPAFGIDIPPLGAHLVALYCVIVMYAIVRYRFLDIQLVIRRSLVYSILVTLLTAGYFGLVYGVEKLFRVTFGYHSAWVSLGAFAVMALVFHPLKLGIQRLVDWLIFRVPQEHLAKRMERLEEQALQTEKFKAVSTLAAGMAHEIKNPLTALKTFAEYIPEKHRDPEFAGKLHDVLTSETQRIQSIVQELLDFARPKPPQLKPVEAGQLISSTINLLSNDLLKRRIKWTIDCRHNGAALQADPDQLRQVLINLIQNAADAMPEGGTLTIATHSVNSHLELTITDTGEGIPADLLPKIFDPFVTTKPDGTGLGLAMVYSIIQVHRGSIRAASHPGRGTTFTVELPL